MTEIMASNGFSGQSKGTAILADSANGQGRFSAAREKVPIVPRAGRGIPQVLIHALAVGLVICLWHCFPAATTLLWGGIVIAVTYICIAAIETRRAAIRISPLSVYFFWYSVKYGLAAIYMSRVIADEGYFVFVGHMEQGGVLVVGYVITLVGSLAFHIGLQMLRPSTSKSHHGGKVIKLSVGIELLLLLWALGLVALYRPVTFGFLGVGIGLLALGPLAALLVLATLPAKFFRLSNSAYWALLLFMTAGLGIVSLGAWYDSKQTIMLSLTPLLAAGIVRPRLRKYVPAALISLVSIYLLAVAPVINRSRTMPGHTTMSPIERYFVAFERYSPLYTGSIQSGFLKQQADRFFVRVFEPEAVGYIAVLVQTSGLKYGATMSNLAYGFIPRILWPGKPIVSLGGWFTGQIRKGLRSSTGMFAAGELFWNFGWAGVLIGMWLLGALVSGLWRMAGQDPRGKLLQMWLFVWILYGFVEIAEASSYLIGIVYCFLFFGALTFLQHVARQTALKEGFPQTVPVSFNEKRSASAIYSDVRSS